MDADTLTDETFVHWMYWDDVGALMVAGIVLLVTSFVCGGLGAIIGEIISQRRHVARERS